MLGTFLVLCAFLGAIFWYLTHEAEQDSLSNPEAGKQEQHQALGRKRNRRRHGGKKSGSTAHHATSRATKAADGDADASMRGESVRSLERRERRELEAKEWPELGAAKKKEDVEDLAVLHASMLRAAKEAEAAEDNERAIRARRHSGRIAVGDKVDARFGGGTSFFPAVVTKTHYGGLVNLLYDDGERENRVPLSLVQLQGRGGSPKAAVSDESDSSTDSDGAVRDFAKPNGRVYPAETTRGSGRGDGWEVITQKPKKTSQQRAEARVEASSNVKNRLKRQRKREKEIAAREALRKKI